MCVLLMSADYCTVSDGVRHRQVSGESNGGLTLYLWLLIAGNKMPSGADQQTLLQQPSAILKPRLPLYPVFLGH